MSRHDDDNEEALFRAAMADVTPLEKDEVVVHRPRVAPIPRQREAEEREALADLMSEFYDPAELETGEELVYLRDGVQRRVLRRLRRGHYSLAAELDLHGMTVSMAREALADFLRDCRRRDHRCVRIIHGKGRRSSNKGPVLKVKVDHWLRQREEVLAFCSARPVDGGSGAVYVLLRYRP